MPAVPGETLLATLFADVHYYIDSSSKPQHDRFDRGSYVYVYHNPTSHTSKLEVANHAGTPEQDAFSGSLSTASMEYSYKQPTLCTVKVDEYVQDQSQWRLPSYDMRNEQKYLYKLHSLDIYLWTEKDAATFLGHLKAVMSSSRLDIKDAPSSAASIALAEHRNSMSPTVQQLEKASIGAHFPPRAESAFSAHSLPGPPTPMTGATASPGPASPPQAAPMAYNPAAPAAPEFIAHREKTPPPQDDGSGTGLASAAKHDTVTQYAYVPQGYHHSNQPTPQQAYFSGPPQQASHATAPSFSGPPRGTPPNQGQVQRSFSGALPPPPPGGPSPQPQHQPQQQQYAPSFAGPPSSNQTPQPTSPPPHQQSFHRQSTFGGQPVAQYASYPQQHIQTQFATYAQSPGFGPSVGSPGMPPTPGYQNMQPPTPSAPPAYNTHTPLQSPGLPPPSSSQPPQQQHAQSQQPQVAGYANYNYAAAQTTQPLNQYGAYTGDVHSQIYRPTEAEAQSHGGHAAKPQPVRQDSATKIRMEAKVGHVEKKVGGFLKRLDKLI